MVLPERIEINGDRKIMQKINQLRNGGLWMLYRAFVS